DARRREPGAVRHPRGRVRADRGLPGRVLGDEVRVDPARGVRAHHRHVDPGRAPVPRRVVRAGPGLAAGPRLAPAEGVARLPPGNVGALELRADPCGPDPRHLVEAPAAGEPVPLDGDRAGGRVAWSLAWQLWTAWRLREIGVRREPRAGFW